MAKLIAGLYEISEQIGSGGGGIVYLGRHVRLDKKVVLKADKRTLRTRTDVLRREVDMLKGLSHTYIPQVYDFVQEDGVVYTVMDYIEGESFDKILARKQYLSQKDLIRWSCQLLDALTYLHSQGEYGILHGDIKPANIMLRSNGDICLIDFNIALALGEDGAVKVGFSRGYASPEHYGAEYVSRGKKSVIQVPFSHQESEQTDVLSEKTLVDEEDVTLVDTVSAKLKAQQSKGTTASKKAILLDVRSDIYSLGATLYHLYSGRKPEPMAENVVPLTKEDCSEQICRIIRKAMMPDPADRYQTAEEMLDAFLNLRKNDSRVVRRKRQFKYGVAACLSFMFFGGAMIFVGQRQMEQHQKALTYASYSEKELKEGNPKKAISFALQSLPNEKSILDAPVTAESEYALSNALGVYQLSDQYVDDQKIELSGTPFDIVVSPSGKRIAVIYAYEVAVYNENEAEPVVKLPAQESAMTDCEFLDDDRIVYAGKEGVTAYDLTKQRSIWHGEVATNLSLSGNKKKLATVNRDATTVQIYDAESGKKIQECDLQGNHMAVPENDRFADPDDYLFQMNENGDRLAVSFSNGGVWLVDTTEKNDDVILYDKSDYIHFSGGFSCNLFAFSAEDIGGKSQMGIVDVDRMELISSMESNDPYLLKTDQNMIYLANANILECIDATSLEEKELAYVEDAKITQYAIGKKYNCIVTDNGKYAYYDQGAKLYEQRDSVYKIDYLQLCDNYAFFANRSDPFIWIQCLQKHSDQKVFTYDAQEVHDEARVSQDKKTLMLFDYEHFTIYGDDGNKVNSIELPKADQIYDQQFIRKKDKSYLEVIWYDGMIRRYSAKDGSMIDEKQGKIPDKSLIEDFWTDNYHIVSKLHEAPEVYNRKNEKFVTKLEEDDFLTYVIQTNKGIICEYITAEGEKYGYLLDEKLNKIAYFPNLCDVVNDSILYDDGTGEIKTTKIFSLCELKELAK